MKKRKFVRPVIFGFVCLYLVSMTLTTWLVKRKFDEEYEQKLSARASMLQSVIREEADSRDWGEELTENQKNYLKVALANVCANSESKFQMFSGAIYDPEGKLTVRSEELIGCSWFKEEDECMYLYYTLSEYLTEEEIEEIARYQSEIYQEDVYTPVPYLVTINVDEAGFKLVDIQIYRAEWTKEEEEAEGAGELPPEYQDYAVTTENTTWFLKSCELAEKWENPDADKDSEQIHLEFMGNFAVMPGIEYGVSYWKQWREDEHLQNYPEEMEEPYSFDQGGVRIYYETGYPFMRREIVYPVIGVGNSDDIYSIAFRTTTHPWLAAMDYMKYVYLGGFLLMILCQAAVIRAMNRTYARQERLEEMRRDFTNAAAHELKTPLGVVRGFAENLKENTMEEKRDYYLDKIVEQTEEMDKLVGEMCDISKLESERLVLQKEQTDMLEILREQEKKVQNLIEKLDLDVVYRVRGAFALEGDRYYLGKAVFNLFSNAAEYNCRAGTICITVDVGFCSIANTKDQSCQEMHQGLGLYLTERIFQLHHLDMTLENTESEFCVKIRSDN